MNEELKKKALAMGKAVGIRFLKGAVAGAIAAIYALNATVPTDLATLLTSLYGLIYVFTAGFLTGGLLAVEKWLNWTDTPPAP